jgi:FKBP-type peptidyl-prolyl cis-trans isomerase
MELKWTKWIAVLGIGLLVAQVSAQEPPILKTQKEKASYALGVDLGNKFRKAFMDVDPAVFSQGLSDALSGEKTLLTEEQARAAVAEMQADLKRKERARRIGQVDRDETERLAAYNKNAGETFLAENRKKEGVVTLPSGLQYKILKKGDGKEPTLEDTVVCHYRGTLIDGKEFYNSYRRNEPMSFALKGADIKGWAEVFPLMPVGSKWQLVVPPDLAYGEVGSGLIGPNATVIYEVELIAIKKSSETAKTMVQ